MSSQIIRPIDLVIATACLFIIMFGIRATAVIINPILLVAIITMIIPKSDNSEKS